jgi:hypothetical protein
MKLIGSNYYGEFNKTPLVDPSRPQWSKSTSTFILIPQSAGVSKITKIYPGKKYLKNFTYFFVFK